MNTLAQLNFAPQGGFKGFGPLGNPTNNGIIPLSDFISTAIGVMTIIAFIWFVFTIFTGAIGIISSGGDKNSLESAKKKITTGVIGVVVVITAIFLIDLVGTIFGIKFLDLYSLFTAVLKPLGTSIPDVPNTPP